MRRRLPPTEGGMIGDQGSLLAGSIVVGLAFAFAGPFITIFIIISSVVYGSAIMLRLMTPKKKGEDLTDW